jgi:hypothetical protein
VLVGGILAAVVVVGVIAAAVYRNRARDDVHSVEHYHRQLHTLEEMRTHSPPGSEEADGENGQSQAASPASAFRVSGSSTVRLTEAGHTIVPPAPPPPVKNPGEPVLFVDSHLTPDPNEPSKTTFMTGVDDKAMHSINHRPKRLGALIALAAVVILIVVLFVAGMHSNNSPHRHPTSGTATTVTTAPTHSRSHPGTAGANRPKSHKTSVTTTTVAPVVSAPAPTSPNVANYQVGVSSYSLALSATSGDCWVSATNTSTGDVLFSGVLAAGQSHTISASGPVTVVSGAPAAFAATVNGVPAQLPFGFQAPFTMMFVTPGTSGGSSSPSTTTTT